MKQEILCKCGHKKQSHISHKNRCIISLIGNHDRGSKICPCMKFEPKNHSPQESRKSPSFQGGSSEGDTLSDLYKPELDYYRDENSEDGTLSSKIIRVETISGKDLSHIPTQHIKEFIRKLKEDLCNQIEEIFVVKSEFSSYKNKTLRLQILFKKEIDKLAGKELLK